MILNDRAAGMLYNYHIGTHEEGNDMIGLGFIMITIGLIIITIAAYIDNLYYTYFDFILIIATTVAGFIMIAIGIIIVISVFSY